MSSELLEQVVEAVLYEGYVLYPYRSNAIKNRQRWNFGVLVPEAACCDPFAAGERSWIQTECIAVALEDALVDVEVRFLHSQTRNACRLGRPVQNPEEITLDLLERVDEIKVAGRCYETWEEAAESRFSIQGLHLRDLFPGPHHEDFVNPPGEWMEPLYEQDGSISGALIRRRNSIKGSVTVSAVPGSGGSTKITVVAKNLTPFDFSTDRRRERMLAYSMLSTHTILKLRQGSFVSLMDPHERFKDAAGSCNNIGVWPVLVGENGETGCMLSSPIILYDYPQIATESAGNLFDGTEIDELLALRVMTLTDDEKMRMSRADELTRRILERTGDFSKDNFMNLHGVMRAVKPRKDEE
jgi:hypothetical protein